jgi:hypothetical protein
MDTQSMAELVMTLSSLLPECVSLSPGWISEEGPKNSSQKEVVVEDLGKTPQESEH